VAPRPAYKVPSVVSFILGYRPDQCRNILAHVTNSVVTEHPSKHRRNTSVTALRLYDFWNMMIYCSDYSLLTCWNGLRKFRSPVQIPSMVL